jgi:hypothetical protein
MHNLFLKEHNRIAGVLFEELSRRSRLSPSKLDELVFQEILSTLMFLVSATLLNILI